MIRVVLSVPYITVCINPDDSNPPVYLTVSKSNAAFLGLGEIVSASAASALKMRSMTWGSGGGIGYFPIASSTKDKPIDQISL